MTLLALISNDELIALGLLQKLVETFVTKKRGSRNLITHVLSSLDPSVHALQIGLTHTDTSTSPKLVRASLISLTLNDSKTDGHNNTTMTQHTSPVLCFHTDVIQRKGSSCILFTEHIHPKVQTSLPADSQKEVWKFSRLLASSLSLFLNSSATEAQLFVRHSGRSLTQPSSSFPKLPSILLNSLPNLL
jgi:hypothetical protein